MNATAEIGGRRVTTKQVLSKQPVGVLTVPLREVNVLESIALGLRMTMFEMGDEVDGGFVATGTGFGSDVIELHWTLKGEQHRAFVRGAELLKAYVNSFSPETAAEFPDDLV